MSEKVKETNIKKGAVDLTIGSPFKKILIFTLPLILGNLFQLGYSWTDAIILGRFEGLEAFGQLSAALPIVNLLLTVVMGFITGASVIIGQLFGTKEYKNLKRCYSTLLIALLIMGVVLTAAGIGLAKPLLRLLQVEDKLLDGATSYLTFYFAGVVFMIAYNVFAQILRSLGNSTMPLIALLICVVLNIGLDLVFVTQTNMGAGGVALATAIAQAVSAVFLFIYMQLKMPIVRLGRKDFVYDGKMFRKTLTIAIPSTVQNLSAVIGFLVINALINSRGAEFTTAFGLGARIDELINSVLVSFSVAITSFAAQNKGKGEIKRIKQGFGSIMIMAAVFMALAITFILIFKESLIKLFISLENVSESGTIEEAVKKIDIDRVIEITSDLLNIYVPSFVFMAILQITSGLLRGAGAAKSAMGINLFSLVVRVSAAFALNSLLYGPFWASPIGWVAGAAWGLAAYFIGFWKKDTNKQYEPELEIVNPEDSSKIFASGDTAECAAASAEERAALSGLPDAEGPYGNVDRDGPDEDVSFTDVGGVSVVAEYPDNLKADIAKAESEENVTAEDMTGPIESIPENASDTGTDSDSGAVDAPDNPKI